MLTRLLYAKTSCLLPPVSSENVISDLDLEIPESVVHLNIPFKAQALLLEIRCSELRLWTASLYGPFTSHKTLA